MGAIARTAFTLRSLSGRDLWSRLAPVCQQPGCSESGRFWRRMRHRHEYIVLQRLGCCLDSCFDRALGDALAEACRAPARAVVRHRIPIGLLLLSRQQLTPTQLRSALDAQLAAGRGRIGEWLENLGYVSEAQVTAALARQWSCPVLRDETLDRRSRGAASIPLSLMRWLAMAPVEFVPSTRTLHLAFAEGLDYSVLYAVEQMLECRTEPCLVRPSILRRHFECLGEVRSDTEVLFEHLSDLTELVRIVRSYAVRVAAVEIRLNGCGQHIWVRLTRPSGNPVDLIVRGGGGVSHSAGSREGCAEAR